MFNQTNIASRTPEGEPNRCPICGKQVIVEPSAATRDAPCPNCGHLLWWFQERLERQIDYKELIHKKTRYATDSLDFVEMVMELEEEYDINIPDEDAEKLVTLGDVIRYISQRTKQSG